MNSVQHVFGCFLLFLFIASSANGQQKNSNKSGWKGDSSKIKTEYISFDFSTTEKLKAVDNATQTPKGIRIEKTDKQGTLLSDEIAVPVDSIAPFLAVGSRLVQRSSGEESQNIQLQIRHTADRQQWSEWQTIEKDDHLTTSPDTLVGRLQFLPDSTRLLQFRVVLGQAQRPTTLQSLKLSFTSPGATSTAVLQELKKQAAKQSARQKSQLNENQDYPMPEYVTRTEWDCPDGQEPSGSVSATDVTHQIIHHSAGTNSSSDWPAVVRSIWDYHVNTNGWNDIGYNWLIDPNGIIYQGRGWINGNDEVQGAHFCGTNSNTMGVCLLGNFEEVQPSTNALNNLEELLAWKSDEKNIDPTERSFHASSGFRLYTISGHRDGCSTLCPGENLYVRLPEIRDNVYMKIGETADTETDIALQYNYPNPFSESTTINFSLERSGKVRITIWDVAGRMVDEVTDQFYEADSHAEIWDASAYASGVYFCRMQFEDQLLVQKMVLVK
ncbi:N-acetylmuramoyl-L-alanine amidase [Fodinibius sp.]|uniref:N-acetylmuramoyl-L-alanine amidase n=1 Tax=Fodinibius sp. TaxID=1872440 RepID=UPI002ACEAF6F|nr:N-acetylmuramoyl-L-alanine amidase [Fodinibius sp.]MDZ7658315.1 N-acetylmuramoyl-L-alanine amidase [Fodinibius sp.]